MADTLQNGFYYTRSLGSWGSVTYHLDPTGDDNDVAVWEIHSGTTHTDVHLTVRCEKLCRNKNEAIQWLREHFDDPLSIRDAAQHWKS